jgi:hypothetical protein
MEINEAQRQLLKAVCDAVIASVKAAGPLGAPGGVLYAALMSYGIRLEQFESLMGALVNCKKLTKRGELYFVGAL